MTSDSPRHEKPSPASSPRNSGTAPANFHVIIIGAGIGGLLLAQGLKRAGISVALYERDASPEFRRQGYRVTVWREGLRSLQRTLPEEVWKLVMPASMEWIGIRVANERLTTLMHLRNNKDRMGGCSIDRLSLRRILLTGLEDVVHFGKSFDRYEEASDGVVVHFQDGSAARCDLLVGADGNESRIRRQLLPQHAELFDTGQRDLAGRIPLTPENQHEVAELSLEAQSLLMILAGRGEVMIIIPQRFGRVAAASGASSHIESTTRDYLYWGLVAHRDKYLRGGVDPPDSSTLKMMATEITRDWHPALRRLVELTKPDDTALLAMKTSVRHPHWGTRRVTLLGDAVHSMVPFRGMGANMAMHDAALLSERLAQAFRGELSLLDAVHAYEIQMLRDGFMEVEKSRAALANFVRGNPFVRRLVQFFMRGAYRAMVWLRIGGAVAPAPGRSA